MSCGCGVVSCVGGCGYGYGPIYSYGLYYGGGCGPCGPYYGGYGCGPCGPYYGGYCAGYSPYYYGCRKC